MDATTAKNLVGDLLAANAVCTISSDGQGGWIVAASPAAGSVSAGQVNNLAVKWSVSSSVPASTFK